MRTSANPFRIARERAGMKRETLCASTGLSYPTIQLAERGLASERTARLIAAALGVPVDQLTGSAPTDTAPSAATTAATEPAGG